MKRRSNKKKVLEFFVNTKYGKIKTNEDLGNYETYKFILLLQKNATFEDLEESIDSEDGIKDIIELIVIKIRGFMQKQENKEFSRPHKITPSIFNSYEKIYRALFEMITRARGLNNFAPSRQDYFENRRFAAKKEMQQRRNVSKKELFKLRNVETLSGQ